MMPSSPLYCDACGAANPTQATRCWACGQLLAASTENTLSALSPPAEPPAPLPALLIGRYRLIGMVGKGGYGAVYKAEDLQRQSALVAIKSINLHGLSSQEIIEATDTFNREVGLLSGLQHANLPRIYGHFTDREHWYLTMDFIAGETLEDYLDRTKGGYLPIEEVLEIGMQLSGVLEYLHSQQPPIIFRDVKPANVMRTATGHLCLIDFGIARRFRPGQKHDTTVLGSPGYAPPEQYGRAQTTVQSDIYSLGATLRYLLTGKEPSEAFPRPAPSYIQGVPVELQQLLGQMLEWDASKRPASMSVVKRALQQIAEERRLRDRGFLPPRVPPAQRPGSAIQPAPIRWAGGQVLQPPAQRGISRRAAIISLVGLVCGVGLAAMGYLRGQYDLSSQSSQTSSGPCPQVSPDPHLLYTYCGHTNPVSAVAWSPDGRRIASGSWDMTVQVWDATDGGNVFIYRGHSDQVWSVAWSLDGRHIASASVDHTVQVWDAATGGNVLTYTGHSGYVGAVAWSPDGRRIASGSYDNTVQVWDAATGGNVLIYKGHSTQVNAVAWSPDGKRNASGSADAIVQVWDAATGRNVLTYKGLTLIASALTSVAWSPDGKRIASASLDVQIWDAADGGHVVYADQGISDGAVAWSPDSKRIASTVSTDVQVRDATNGSHIYTYRDGNSAIAVAWSPDGRRIASGSNDGTVRVWQAE